MPQAASQTQLPSEAPCCNVGSAALASRYTGRMPLCCSAAQRWLAATSQTVLGLRALRRFGTCHLSHARPPTCSETATTTYYFDERCARANPPRVKPYASNTSASCPPAQRPPLLSLATVAACACSRGPAVCRCRGFALAASRNRQASYVFSACLSSSSSVLPSLSCACSF